MAVSPGGLGGVRVIPRLKDFLGELGFHIMLGFVIVPDGFNAFDENGNIISEETEQQVHNLIETFKTI